MQCCYGVYLIFCLECLSLVNQYNSLKQKKRGLPELRYANKKCEYQETGTKYEPDTISTSGSIYTHSQLNPDSYCLKIHGLRTTKKGKQKHNSSKLQSSRKKNNSISEKRPNVSEKTWIKKKILTKLKRLKFVRFAAEKKEKKKRSLDKFIGENFPTNHYTENQTNIINAAFKKELDDIETLVNNAAKIKSLPQLKKALSRFDGLSFNIESNPRALNQKAEALSLLYYITREPRILGIAIDTYTDVLKFSEVSTEQFRLSTEKYIYLLEGLGYSSQAVAVQLELVSRIPNDIDVLKKLGRMYWFAGEHISAQNTFTKVLEINPTDPFAMVFLGYILYNQSLKSLSMNGNLEMSNKILRQAATLIASGIESNNPNVMDGNYFYTGADAFRRLQMEDESNRIFLEAVGNDLFVSFWQRSASSVVKGIQSKPIWKKEEIKDSYLLDIIQEEWERIRKEALAIYRSNLYVQHYENIKDTGNWEIYMLYRNGRKNIKNCRRAPVTCTIIDEITHISHNRKGNVKFSIMASGTHVHPHSGPTNCRLRAHLGLDIPTTNMSYAAGSPSRLRVLNEYITWENGKIVIFDDSFDHEVWHFSKENQPRLILIMDMWHPGLNEDQISLI